MIKIETKLLPKPHMQDKISSLTVAAVNSAVTSYAEYLEERMPQLYCSKHPDHVSVVVVKAECVESLKAVKHNFCCQEFESAVEILPPADAALEGRNNVKS